MTAGQCSSRPPATRRTKTMLDMAQTREDWFSEVLPVQCEREEDRGRCRGPEARIRRYLRQGSGGRPHRPGVLLFEAAILGSFWGKEMLLAEQQGRICDVPVNTNLTVHIRRGTSVWTTPWPCGYFDYPDHIDIVDYYEGHGQGFDHYCAWLDERGYRGTDWIPHDAKVANSARLEPSQLRRSSR